MVTSGRLVTLVMTRGWGLVLTATLLSNGVVVAAHDG